MLQSRPDRSGAGETPLPTTTRALCWTAFVLDVILVVYMLRMGSTLDASPVFSMITLGGHHRIVCGLAVAGMLLLAVLAPWTQGFAQVDRLQRVLVPVAGLLSLSALAGLLSLVAFVAGAVLVLVLLVTPRSWAHIGVHQWRR